MTTRFSFLGELLFKHHFLSPKFQFWLFSLLPNVLHRSLIVYKMLPWRLLKAAFSFFIC